MKRSFLLAGAALAACLTGAAFAQSDTPPPGDGHHKEASKTRTEVEARVRAQFARFDTNHDGVLTPDELRPHMPSEADRQTMRDHMFGMMDKDGNGQISKAEFDAFHVDHMPMPHGHDGMAGTPPPPMEPGPMRHHRGHGAMAWMMFRHADADHDGKVSLAEAEKAALDRFDTIDTNHDGVISDAERAAAHRQMATRFRERRAHWMEHKSDMPPPAPAPKG